MKKRDVLILVITIVLLCSLLGVYFFTKYSGSNSNKATPFQVEALDGTTISLNSETEDVILLDFMSVTCTACKEMYPVLRSLWADPLIRDNVTMLSLEIDSFTSEDDLREHKQEYNLSWYVAFAPENMIQDYKVVALPTFVIISSEGIITFHESGIVTQDTLYTALEQTIKGELTGTTITTRSEFTIGFAVLTGVASFFSPCAFPLLPSYLAHIIGQEKKKKEDNLIEDEKATTSLTDISKNEQQKSSSLFYLLIGSIGGIGILLSYALLGGLITVVGSSIKNFVPYLVPIIGGILILLGISMFTNFSIQFNSIQQWLNKKQRKIKEHKRDKENLAKMNQTFLYGIGYGLASLGCNAPIFFAFAFQISSLTVIKIILAYLAFALTIIFLMAFATLLISLSRDALLKKIQSATDIIKKVASVIIIIVGIYLLLEFFLLD